MKLFQWLKSIKMPPPESSGRKVSASGQEKIYYPRSRVPEMELNPDNTQSKETDRKSTSRSFKEQRRYVRYPIEGRNIQAKMILSEEVDVANMSIGGACIVTKRTMSPGEKVLISIADGNIDQPLKCKVIWESESSNDDQENRAASYKTGVQFQDVPPYTLIRLKDYMRESGVPDMKKLNDQHLPSSLRFKIYRNQKAFMKYPSTCPVKKISLGGMLIETNQEYAVEQRYSMAVYLSDESPPIKCIGRIASQLPVSNQPAVRYDTGIEFFKLADQDRTQLRTFISHL